jgi:predicted nucleic acid-binding Zn ribbon protein
MPTYVYETLPQKSGRKPRRFEIKQSMHDAPLTQHPETGEPVQRVIAGGIGVITQRSAPPRPEGCCGGMGGEGCHCACEN